MTEKKRGFLLALTLFVLSSVQAEPDLVEKGVLDFQFQELSEIYALTGEWSFLDDEGVSSYISVPGGWESNTGYTYGRGVYSLTILNDHRQGGEAAMLLPRLNQDIRVYIDGKLVYDSISIGSTFLRFSRSIIPVPREREVKILIIMENTFFRRGGMHHAFLYGPYSQVLQYKYRHMIREAAISGILFFLFLYNLFLFISHYAVRSSLYLSITTFLFSLRGLMSGEVLIEMLSNRVLMDVAFRLNYFFLYLGTVSIILFIRSFFSFQKRAVTASSCFFCAVGTILALLSLLLPLSLLSRSVFVLQGYSLLIFFYSLLLVSRGAVKRINGSLPILIGTLAFLVFVLIDMYSIHRGNVLFEVSQVGLLIFLLSDFLVLSRKFGQSYLQADKLSRELEKEVARQTRELKKLSRTDPLTGINNRRRFMELGQRELGIHRRKARPLSLLMMDLDHFKKVNDKYGHSGGDRALVFMTRLCLEEIRESDILGRLGGEEFAIILLETDLPGAREIGERIRARLEEATSGRDDQLPPLTASIGVICFTPDESLEGGLDRADGLMYQAKQAGRNRVVS